MVGKKIAEPHPLNRGNKPQQTNWPPPLCIQTLPATGLRQLDQGRHQTRRPTAYSLMRPSQMSRYIAQSPMKLYSGRLKLAGLFFSKPKWPIHAKP